MYIAENICWGHNIAVVCVFKTHTDFCIELHYSIKSFTNEIYLYTTLFHMRKTYFI